MKIGQLDNKPAVSPLSTERKGKSGDAAATSTATAAGSTPEASAKVELTNTAALLGPDASTPEFDADKVQRLAQAIRDGKFQVNPEAIADKLISNAAELLNRTAH
jgi:negative regulator of flagellin synthesis FlgM